MCGVSGICFFDDNRQVESDVVVRAVNQMNHRGPDDSGCYVNGNIGLGHRRLGN